MASAQMDQIITDHLVADIARLQPALRAQMMVVVKLIADNQQEPGEDIMRLQLAAQALERIERALVPVIDFSTDPGSVADQVDSVVRELLAARRAIVEARDWLKETGVKMRARIIPGGATVNDARAVEAALIALDYMGAPQAAPQEVR